MHPALILLRCYAAQASISLLPLLPPTQVKSQQLEAAERLLSSNKSAVAELRSSQAQVAELVQVQREAQELRGSLTDLSGSLTEAQEEQGRLQGETQALRVRAEGQTQAAALCLLCQLRHCQHAACHCMLDVQLSGHPATPKASRAP